MRKTLAMAVLLACTGAQAQMTPIGLWQSIDDGNGQPKAEISIAQGADGRLFGKVERSLVVNSTSDTLCVLCTDDRKNQPKVGLEIIRGGKKAEGKDVWEGGKITQLTGEIGMKAMGNADEVGAAAVDYLRVVGHMVYGYFWARMAKVALEKIAQAEAEAQRPDPFYLGKLQTARFYFTRLMPETSSLMRRIRAGSDVLMDTDAALA